MIAKWFVWKIMQKSIGGRGKMPQPIPDVIRAQTCTHPRHATSEHHRSPALKGEYHRQHSNLIRMPRLTLTPLLLLTLPLFASDVHVRVDPSAPPAA